MGLLQGLAPVLSGCVFQRCRPRQPFLMRADEQQKQMEWPVGLWEDSGRARTAVWEEASAMWWRARFALWSFLLVLLGGHPGERWPAN